MRWLVLLTILIALAAALAAGLKAAEALWVIAGAGLVAAEIAARLLGPVPRQRN